VSGGGQAAQRLDDLALSDQRVETARPDPARERRVRPAACLRLRVGPGKVAAARASAALGPCARFPGEDVDLIAHSPTINEDAGARKRRRNLDAHHTSAASPSCTSGHHVEDSFLAYS